MNIKICKLPFYKTFLEVNYYFVRSASFCSFIIFFFELRFLIFTPTLWLSSFFSEMICLQSLELLSDSKQDIFSDLKLTECDFLGGEILSTFFKMLLGDLSLEVASDVESFVSLVRSVLNDSLDSKSCKIFTKTSDQFQLYFEIYFLCNKISILYTC